MRSNRTYRKLRRHRKKYTRKQRGGQASPTISFISYGNEKYAQSRERIRKEAEQMGCFNGQIKVYTPEDLSEDFKTAAVRDVLNDSRGGGYWIWKPYVIMDMLSKINDNDILLYADAGCKLDPTGVPRLKEYMEMIAPKSNKAVLAMRLVNDAGVFLTKKWTSMQIFDYFKQPLDGTISNTSQILAGVVMCRKCPESLEVIGKWLDVAKTHPDLFTDRHNEESKRLNPDFVENRHDQAVWSMIVQTEPYAKNCIIIDEEIERGQMNKPIHAQRIK